MAGQHSIRQRQCMNCGAVQAYEWQLALRQAATVWKCHICGTQGDIDVGAEAEVTWEDFITFTSEVSIYPGANTGDVREISYVGLGIAGEAGEVVDLLKKIIRSSDDQSLVYLKETSRAKISEEMGDLMWYVGRMCQIFDLRLPEILAQNVEKLIKRQKTGQIKNHPSTAGASDV